MNKKGLLNLAISDRLTALREDHDLDQIDLAPIFKVERKTISRAENGVTEPKISLIIEYAKYFNVSCDYILGLIDIPKPLYPNKKNALPVASGKSVQIGDIGSHNKIDIKQ